MNELPDFANMTKDEIGEWFLNNDTSALLAGAERPAPRHRRWLARRPGRPPAACRIEYGDCR
jgi:hypothetical protein